MVDYYLCSKSPVCRCSVIERAYSETVTHLDLLRQASCESREGVANAGTIIVKPQYIGIESLAVLPCP